MLRSLKASLKSGKKASSSPKEEGPSSAGAPRSITHASKAGPVPSAKPPTAAKDKPGLPSLDDASLAAYFAAPLPSFR